MQASLGKNITQVTKKFLLVLSVVQLSGITRVPFALRQELFLRPRQQKLEV